jgi:hypothetical protein
MSIVQCSNPTAAGYEPGRHDSISSPELWAAHQEAAHTETYKGAVLRLGERNGYHDSDFYAVVWDEEAQTVRTVEYATTRGWTYHNGADIDASREVIEKAVAYLTGVRFAEWQRKHRETPRKGYTARATEKGVRVEGVIAWEGTDRPRSNWDARYGTRTARYGIKVEGRKGYVFRNVDAPDFEFDPEPVSEADMVEWRARCEASVRAEFAQALALADEREPLPGPGDVVDAQEADADGMRLYAVGETMCDDEWAQGVARAVVDESVADYQVMGKRRDGSQMPLRTVTVFQALGHVARWAENDGAMVAHDGRGVVRIVRRDGACLFLVPVREGDGQEAPQGPQEAAQGAQEAAQGEPCANCRGVVEVGQEAGHGAPCVYCGSDGHAGCQHVHERVA